MPVDGAQASSGVNGCGINGSSSRQEAAGINDSPSQFYEARTYFDALTLGSPSHVWMTGHDEECTTGQ